MTTYQENVNQACLYWTCRLVYVEEKKPFFPFRSLWFLRYKLSKSFTIRSGTFIVMKEKSGLQANETWGNCFCGRHFLEMRSIRTTIRTTKNYVIQQKFSPIPMKVYSILYISKLHLIRI